MNFYIILSTLVIFLATIMIFLKTPTNTTLSLCVILLLSTLLLFLSHVEFLAYIFIMVYVGGIALLFLFVIIMLNLKIDYNKNKKSFRLLSGPTILFLVLLKIQSFLSLQLQHLTQVECLNMNQVLKAHHFFSNDILNFGLLMYTHYFFNFLLAGVLLLIAMVSVLVLSLNNIKNQ